MPRRTTTLVALIAVAVAVAFVPAVAGAAEAPAARRPPASDRTATKPTDGQPSAYPPGRALWKTATPKMAMPGYLATVTDPVFGTRITRVSDRTAMGVDLSARQYIRNAYAKKAAWNSDGSLLLLSQTHPAPLLDGRTYRYLGLVDDPSDSTWANTDPDTIFGVRPEVGDFVAYHPRTGQTVTELHLDGYSSLSLGDGEGNLSDDDRWVALHGRRADGSHDLIVFDRLTRRTVMRGLGDNAPNWIGMSHSGKYVIINWDENGVGPYGGVGVWDRDTLGFLRQLDTVNSHGDPAYDTSGREVYVAGDDCHLDAPPAARCPVAAAVSAFPLDGSRTYPVIARSTGYRPWDEHVSGRALHRPGWIYLSDYGPPPPNPPTYPGRDTAFAVEVDPTRDAAQPEVQPFAHLHHEGGLPYQSMPFAVPDPTGTRGRVRQRMEPRPRRPGLRLHSSLHSRRHSRCGSTGRVNARSSDRTTRPGTGAPNRPPTQHGLRSPPARLGHQAHRRRPPRPLSPNHHADSHPAVVTGREPAHTTCNHARPTRRKLSGVAEAWR